MILWQSLRARIYPSLPLPCRNLVVIALKLGFLGGSKKNRGYFWGYFSINSKIKSL